MSADIRLATYGTLAPGEVNHGQVSMLEGGWTKGTVRGQLFKEGWGADHGCPGIVLDGQGDVVEVFVFESPDLPTHWERLDRFEGEEYRRVQTSVRIQSGETVEAFIYELAR